MDHLKLEPYAVVLTLTFPEIQDRWGTLLSDFLIWIAKESTKSGKAVVGHIKTLSVFQGKQFYRMSVVAAEIPPTTEGQIPPGYTQLEITLNVLVYGIPGAELEEIVRAAAEEVATKWRGTVRQRTVNQAGDHLHQSNHKDENKGENYE